MADKMNKRTALSTVALAFSILFLVLFSISVTGSFIRAHNATENCRSYATQLEQALGQTNAALTATQDDQELLANWHMSQAQDAISSTNRLAKLCYEVRR